MKIKIEVQNDRQSVGKPEFFCRNCPGPESAVSKVNDPIGNGEADKNSEISFNGSDEQIAEVFSEIAVVDKNLEFGNNSGWSLYIVTSYY
jgi:hypothetical protein